MIIRNLCFVEIFIQVASWFLVRICQVALLGLGGITYIPEKILLFPKGPENQTEYERLTNINGMLPV